MADALPGARAAVSDYPVRIAYLCLESPREGQASYAHVQEIVRGLERRGYAVDLYAPSGSWERPPIAARVLRSAALQLRLARRLGDFNLIYIRAHPLAYLTAMLCRLLGKPTVHEVNGAFIDVLLAHPVARPSERLLNAMQRAQYRWASAVIAVTDGLAAWVRSELASAEPRVSVVPNGANTELFNPAAKDDRALPARYAVFTGGMTQWHGVETMLAAVARPEWPADLSLVFIGDGPEMHKIRASSQEEPRIVPLGRLPYNDVPGVVAGACIGLVPITNPGGRARLGLAPVKLFEFLACGVPVIVTDFPGQAELVRRYACGLVIPDDDPEALARAVAKLAGAGEEARAMGRRGRDAIVAEHSWDSRANDTSKIIARLVMQGAR